LRLKLVLPMNAFDSSARVPAKAGDDIVPAHVCQQRRVPLLLRLDNAPMLGGSHTIKVSCRLKRPNGDYDRNQCNFYDSGSSGGKAANSIDLQFDTTHVVHTFYVESSVAVTQQLQYEGLPESDYNITGKSCEQTGCSGQLFQKLVTMEPSTIAPMNLGQFNWRLGETSKNLEMSICPPFSGSATVTIAGTGAEFEPKSIKFTGTSAFAHAFTLTPRTVGLGDVKFTVSGETALSMICGTSRIGDESCTEQFRVNSKFNAPVLPKAAVAIGEKFNVSFRLLSNHLPDEAVVVTPQAKNYEFSPASVSFSKQAGVSTQVVSGWATANNTLETEPITFKISGSSAQSFDKIPAGSLAAYGTVKVPKTVTLAVGDVSKKLLPIWLDNTGHREVLQVDLSTTGLGCSVVCGLGVERSCSKQSYFSAGSANNTNSPIMLRSTGSVGGFDIAYTLKVDASFQISYPKTVVTVVGVNLSMSPPLSELPMEALANGTATRPVTVSIAPDQSFEGLPFKNLVVEPFCDDAAATFTPRKLELNANDRSASFTMQFAKLRESGYKVSVRITSTLPSVMPAEEVARFLYPGLGTVTPSGAISLATVKPRGIAAVTPSGPISLQPWTNSEVVAHLNTADAEKDVELMYRCCLLQSKGGNCTDCGDKLVISSKTDDAYDRSKKGVLLVKKGMTSASFTLQAGSTNAVGNYTITYSSAPGSLYDVDLASQTLRVSINPIIVSPTLAPTAAPTIAPTATAVPTDSPTGAPTYSTPTLEPTYSPTASKREWWQPTSVVGVAVEAAAGGAILVISIVCCLAIWRGTLGHKGQDDDEADDKADAARFGAGPMMVMSSGSSEQPLLPTAFRRQEQDSETWEQLRRLGRAFMGKKHHKGKSSGSLNPQLGEAAGFSEVEAASWGVDLNELKIGEEIGSGASAQVFRGTYFGNKVAVKRLFCSLMEGEADEHRQLKFSEFFRTEASMLAMLHHPNVVRFYGAAYSPRDHRGYLVTELCDKGSLSAHIRAKSAEVARDKFFNIANGISNGMQFFHAKQYVHRDLKPDNVLLDDNSVVKLCDFGLSRFVEDSSTQGNTMTAGIGTPAFMAVELIVGDCDDAHAGTKIDVFSFGVMMWVLWTQRLPYMEKRLTPFTLMNKVIEGLRPDRPDDIPDRLWLLMQQCWAHDPIDRPPFSEIGGELLEIEITMVEGPPEGRQGTCV
jgi:tRNA A-37 threonylcarbamoyl transferase component Bud32